MNFDKVKSFFLKHIIYQMTSKELFKWSGRIQELALIRCHQETITKIHERFRHIDPKHIEQLYLAGETKLLKEGGFIIFCGKKIISGSDKDKAELVMEKLAIHDPILYEIIPYSKLAPYHREYYFDYWGEEPDLKRWKHLIRELKWLKRQKE